MGKTYQEIGSLARMELNTRNSSKFLSSHPTLVSQIYCKSPTCFSNLTWASCTSLQMFVSFLFHLLSNLSSRDSHRKDFWWRKAHASALSAWPELIGATWVILFFLYSGCAEKCCVTSGLNKATCSPSMPCFECYAQEVFAGPFLVTVKLECFIHVLPYHFTANWFKIRFSCTCLLVAIKPKLFWVQSHYQLRRLLPFALRESCFLFVPSF